MLVGPSNREMIRVSYSQNYKTAISDKIACWEGEQFPNTRSVSVASNTPSGRGCGVVNVAPPPIRYQPLLKLERQNLDGRWML